MFNLFAKPFRCFMGEYGNLKISSRTYKGIKVIPIDKIVGTVGRCHNDAKWSEFRWSERYKSIKRAMNDLEYLPPIKVYQVDDEYYILDGHHRVAAGRDIDKEYLDAEVIEYKFSGEKENSDYQDCPMKEFNQETGLTGLLVNSEEKYRKLLDYIKGFSANLKESIPFTEAAKKWYHDEFLPLVLNSLPDDSESDEEKYLNEKKKEDKQFTKKKEKQ